MNYKAVVFDLDGTLLDTLEDIAGSVNKALTEKGFPTHTLEAYRRFIGDGPRELVARALPRDHRHPDIIADRLDAYLGHYKAGGEPHTRLFPGIADLLDELVQRQIKLAILSNKRHDLARSCAGRFLARWYFDVVLGLRKSIPRKPHPAGAFEVADHLSLNPEKVVYVGDSDTDMETALSANMFPVGVSWGFRPADELRESGAELILEHPLQLLDLFMA